MRFESLRDLEEDPPFTYVVEPPTVTPYETWLRSRPAYVADDSRV